MEKGWCNYGKPDTGTPLFVFFIKKSPATNWIFSIFVVGQSLGVDKPRTANGRYIAEKQAYSIQVGMGEMIARKAK
ncbi:hypothetical protein [Desulfobacter curvatus]|uniref:hypothetical protein n=1 Tax=Desulfobacter curvatus TaxID=2290 RepID=UPI0003703368|nr:hypothetical protein [Desulfobacter curvatus]